MGGGGAGIPLAGDLGEVDGLGTCFAGKAISGGGGLGVGAGETTGIVADSQGSFRAAGGMGFPVPEIRDGNGR